MQTPLLLLGTDTLQMPPQPLHQASIVVLSEAALLQSYQSVIHISHTQELAIRTLIHTAELIWQSGKTPLILCTDQQNLDAIYAQASSKHFRIVPVNNETFRHFAESQPKPLDAAPPHGHLYIMLGLPGSGKTTAAQTLAAITHAVHISSDDYRLALFDEPDFTEHEHELLYATLNHCTSLLLAQRYTAIYDANVNRTHHRQEKYDLCAQTGASCTLLWVQTSQTLARDRRVNDSHELLRPPYESPGAMFDRIASIFEAPDPAHEPYIVLDGTKISPDYIRGILELP
jgi:predicted kinase